MVSFFKQWKNQRLSVVLFTPVTLIIAVLCGCDFLNKSPESETSKHAEVNVAEPNPLLQFAGEPEIQSVAVQSNITSPLLDPTEAEVRRLLGEPNGQATISNRTILLYTAERIEFIDGKLINPKPDIIKRIETAKIAEAGQIKSQVSGATKSSAPSGKNVFTQKEFLKNLFVWQKNLFLKDYAENTTNSSPLDVQVRAFLTKYAECASADSDKEIWNLAKKMGQDLINTGCSDALVVYAYGSTVYIVDGPESAEPLVRKGLQLLESSNYSAYYRFLATRRLQSLLYDLHQNYSEAQKLNRLKWEYLAQAASNKAFSNGNQRYYMALFIKEWGLEAGNKLPSGGEEFIRKLEKNKNADPWIRLVAKGTYHITKAWVARGSGWAYEVTKWGWYIFGKELSRARKCLTEAQSLHPEFPEASALMITVSMGSCGKNEPRVWFNRSVSAQFDYLPAYNSMFWALRPRWGGSHEKMYALGLECLNTKRFDTEVPRYFLNALWTIGSELKEWRNPYQRSGVYEQLQVFFNGMLHEPTRVTDKDYWLSAYAIASWAAGQYPEAKKLFDEVGCRVDKSVFPDWGVEADRVLSDVNLQTGSFRNEFAQAEELFSENQSLEALPLFESLINKLKTNPSALLTVQDRVAVLQTRANFLKGEWFNLILNHSLLGWEQKGGVWTVDPDGTLKGVSRETDDRLMILNKCIVDRDYELRGEVEANFKASLVLGYSKELMSNFVGIILDKNANQVSIYRAPDSSKEAIKFPVKLERKNRFLVRVSNGKITLYVNDKQILETPAGICQYPQGELIGMLADYYRCKGYEIRFRNLELRSLK